MESRALFEPRALLVSGKGGVGKSTVAAAIAVAGARSGRRTCLVEVEGRQTMRSLFHTEPWDFTEREIRPDLFGMSIDPEASLAEYLAMFYGAKRLSRLVVNSTAVDFATTAAPGIKDVLLIGKVKEMERRRDPDGRFVYDLIIVDAPPTGRIVNFLRAPEATTELVTVGPIRDQATSLVELLLDPARLRIQLVTLLEEMPIAETIDSARALEELGVQLNPIIANRVLQPQLDPAAAKAADGLTADAVAPLLERVGLDAAGTAGTLLALGRRHLRRLALQDEMRTALSERLRVPALELPYLATREFGEDELRRLAGVIEQVQP
ncbi:MAG TPA: ArsA-related P-loop ATPase [Euzebyales bacterium]|nr:ArsA-related P-loop ATPase [Euzebyales bacterium]